MNDWRWNYMSVTGEKETSALNLLYLCFVFQMRLAALCKVQNLYNSKCLNFLWNLLWIRESLLLKLTISIKNRIVNRNTEAEIKDYTKSEGFRQFLLKKRSILYALVPSSCCKIKVSIHINIVYEINAIYIYVIFFFKRF